MSERRDFEKILVSLGGMRIESGTKQERWRIGTKIITVPNNLSGWRAFRNYEAQARRVAREEGIFQEAPAKTFALSNHKVKVANSRPRTEDRPAYSAAATRQDLEEWNARENMGWKTFWGEGRLEMETTKRHFIREPERIHVIQQTLRETGQPLSAIEIAKSAWDDTEETSRAVLRILLKYPRIFRPTRGQQRNERYTLETGEQPATLTPPPLAGELCPVGEPSTTEDKLAELSKPKGIAAATAVSTPIGDAEEKLKRVCKILEEFSQNPVNRKEPYWSFYVLGRITEIVEQTEAAPRNRRAEEMWEGDRSGA